MTRYWLAWTLTIILGAAVIETAGGPWWHNVIITTGVWGARLLTQIGGNRG